MSFATPLILLALLAVPLAITAYARQQRRRDRAASAFVTEPMIPSVAPSRPGWRRHAPMFAFALAVVGLVLAAAQPQRSVAVPLTDGAVVLADDVSSSMAATDVQPSRLIAAERAAARFARSVPGAVRVGLMKFNQKPTLLQSPSTDHSLTVQALPELRVGGHTAIGSAIASADQILAALHSPAGRRIPAAIVLLSDGTSNTGVDSVTAARRSAQQHVPVYTVALGTAHGTITVRQGNATKTVPVPLNPSELQQIARASGGRTFTAANAAGLSTVYAHLAAQLGHKHVQQQITSTFAGAGLVLLLLGGALSLRWFGRLA
jgi:Ca-activated chloride channel family protein